MKDFRKLSVWHKSHQLALDVYRLTAAFPRTEVYGLTNQMRRSGASIPTNIAEGCGRGGDTELARFLQIAAGSASELEYQLLLAHDLNYSSDADYQVLNASVIEVIRMLASLIKRLEADDC